MMLCQRNDHWFYADYSAANVILDPTKSLILTRTAVMDLRRLDAGVFDVTYDIPLAENDTTLKAFLFRVELDNSVRYILQVCKINVLSLSLSLSLHLVPHSPTLHHSFLTITKSFP